MIKHSLILWLTAIINIGCTNQEKELYVAKDYISDNIFTSGIEGPAVDCADHLFAVNFEKEGTIGIVKNGQAELYVELPEGSIGNGIRFDQEGNMYIADYPKHNILRLTPGSREIEIFAHEEQMNQPNDLAITRSGILFASDPDWKNSSGNLWRIEKDGTCHLLESNMGTTNGIEVSPNDNLLYVNESVQRKVWVYDLSKEGNISNKRLLIEFPDYGMDGMRCDEKGNLYISRYGKGTVVKVSPKGKIIREIALKGKKPSNIAFGGKDGKTIYVTLQDRGAIECFRVRHKGRASAFCKK